MTKYDVRINPCYQVDWQNVGSGKRVCQTKRRIRWRFGFSNKEAIADGQTGTACRGEEHEVSLTWSLTSGKRIVTADGQEVHFSYGKRTDTKFETSWSMTGGHIIKLIAHAAPPLFQTPGFKQYDLLLDGWSFFDFPKIYELGVTPMNKKSRALAVSTKPGGSYAFAQQPGVVTPTGSSSTYDEDEDYYESRSSCSAPPLATTKSVVPERTEPPKRHASEPVPAPVVDLLSLDAEPAGGQQQGNLLDSSAPTMNQQDEFAPVTVAAPPAIQAAPFASVSNQIMSQYGTNAAAAAPMALANESHTYYAPPPSTPVYQQQPSQQQYQGYYQQPAPATQQTQYAQQGYYQQHPNPVTPQSHGSGDQYSVASNDSASEKAERDQPSPSTVIVPSMAPLSLEALDAASSDEKAEVSEMEKAFKALVNLDDIELELDTPEQIKLKEKKMQNQPARSKPAPPRATDWRLGQNAKLGDIQQHAPPKTEPKKEIMRTHAFDPAAVHAGMMVVYGAPAPSIPAAYGFGAGSMHQQQAHYQQQQFYQQQQQQYTTPVYTGY